MKKLFLLCAILVISLSTYGQFIFAKRYTNCQTDMFCLDCGDQKVTTDSVKFAAMMKDLNARVAVNNMKGSIIVQVLVDSLGKGCVLSHTETKGHIVAEKIVMALNDFRGWNPAITNGKKERLVSVNVLFTIINGIVIGKVDRITQEFADRFFDTDSGVKY